MALPALPRSAAALQVDGDPDGLVLFSAHPVLSPAEAAAVVAWAEAEGFDEAPINGRRGPERRPDVRNNARVMIDDPAFADALWARVGPLFRAPGPHGLRAAGLNERMRIYRYDVGMYFKPHVDGAWVRPDGSQRSLQTMMVYLNDDFDGGETRFHEVGAEVVPRTGQATVFWHRQLHEGCTVTRGRKYALRTDVMYG